MITTITTTLGEFLAIKIDKGVKVIAIESDLLIVSQPHRPDYEDYILLPFKGLEILDFASKLTEEQWRGIVPDSGGKIFDYDHTHYPSYPNYLTIDHPFDSMFVNTAMESGHSLLKSHGIHLVNPFNHTIDLTKEIGSEEYNHYRELWQSAQLKVHDPLILKAR